MKALANTPGLEEFNQELFSVVRRSVNSLKQKQVKMRKEGLTQLMRIVKEESLPTHIFQQILQMGLKEIIKSYYDHSEANREQSINLTIELLSRCKNINTVLPYILEALKDRTNCVDLQGIDRLPEKLRPHPGQKPKIMIKLLENCEQIRVLYCQLIKRIIFLLDKDQREMIRHLDDMVNIQRALLMDPAPDIQKIACETLTIFCNDYKDILLHFTENMGRAVLLPLISKKSKIRIAALNTLTAILWCGLWKYNAFVFENLIGFRDPNSVPIKDFYEPNHNVNYLATFIVDSNVKVRRQFLSHIKIWVCELNDKFDHHSKIVPYILSGLSDDDQVVRNTAKETIQEIGRQIEEEKQKEFRENRQFAIDAKWTWQGKLIDLPLEEPLEKRPSLGSRYFIRGSVRKFWSALYKQIRDIKEQNRIRSAKLALFGAIYTQNYLTQFLDNMIPQLLPSIIPNNQEDAQVADYVAKIFFYIGRYCQQSAYIHLMQDALNGTLIQNTQFVRCAMKGLSMMIKGNLQAIPESESLCHKKDNIIELLRVLEQCKIAGDVYNFNCSQAKEIAISLFEGIQKKGSEQQKRQILQEHFLNLLKLLSVSEYENLYSEGFSMKKSEQVEKTTSATFSSFVNIINRLFIIYEDSIDEMQEYLENIFCDPPSLMDSDWKILVILYRFLCHLGKSEERFYDLYLLTQDALCSCLKSNKSVEMLMFSCKYIHNLILVNEQANKNSLSFSTKFLVQCLKNLYCFKPMKKVPVYDQHLVKDESDPNIIRTSETNYIEIFHHCSQTFVYYYINQIGISKSQLAEIIDIYVKCLSKIEKYPESIAESVRTFWGVFQKISDLDQNFPNQLVMMDEDKQKKPVMPVVIDFCVQRLEEYLEPALTSMTFNILQKIVKCWPKINSITQKLPFIYQAFPDLLQKLFKYALNEKDIENKHKYIDFLSNLAKKMPVWFKYEADMAEKQRRYEKSRMLQDILKEASIS